MLRFLLRRLAGGIATLIAVTFLVYILFYLAPGDPAAVILANRLGQLGDKSQVEEVREEYGLDRPVVIQYLDWGRDVLQGNLGVSYRSGTLVADEIGKRLGPTVLLAVVTTLFTLLVGIPIGFLAAWRHNTFWDHVARTGTLFSVSIPNFWLAFLLILVFSINLEWLPTHGMNGIITYIMPVIALGLANAARLSRLTRSALMEVLHQEYLRTAHAKGLTERAVWLRHALPNIAVPLVTMVTNQFIAVVAGSVIIETLFGWPGIGNYYIVAVHYRDIPVIQALVLFFAVTFLLMNFLCDISYAIFDPRIRITE